MKVALLASDFGYYKVLKVGGPGIYAWSLHKALDAVGVDNKVFYEVDGQYDFYLDKNTILCKLRRPKGKKAIKTDGFDVFHCLNSYNHIRLCNMSGIVPIAGANIIPNSAPEHALRYLTEHDLKLRQKMIEAEKEIIKNAKVSMWTAQSYFQLSEYKRLGMENSEERTRIIRNAIDTEGLFKKPSEYRNYITWTGKRSWTKLPSLLFRIAKMLPEENFVALSEDYLGLSSENVSTVIGTPHFKMPDRLNSKLHICTSSTENNSLGILEAMAKGIPVVATNVSGNPEVIEHGKTGFLYSRESPKEAVEYIELLSQDEKLRKQIGINARKFIEKNYSFKAIGKNLIKVYREVI